MSAPADNPEIYLQCAAILARADGLLITAGAGMGVDSGLPDFRGEGGFWKHYPALGRAGMDFYDIASPPAFRRTPRLAWGFYGHRLRLYRRTMPNPGFGILKEIASRMRHGAFVFTSNVDGQFQKAGFAKNRVLEVHGSIHHLQCLAPCGDNVWPADGFDPEVDEDRCELVSDPPLCPHCGGMARPNVLMFGDHGWVPGQAERCERLLMEWLRKTERLAVIEIGAGTDVPTVRRFSQAVDGTLIRINPKEPELSEKQRSRKQGIGLRTTGLAALREIRAAMQACAPRRHQRMDDEWPGSERS